MLSDSGNPTRSVVVKHLAQDDIGEVQSMYLLAFKAKSLAGCQEFPVARVSGTPFFQCVRDFVVRKQIEVGAVEDAILILDKKCAHFFRRQQHQVFHSRGRIDGKIRILVQMTSDVVEISLHAAQMHSYHP